MINKSILLAAAAPLASALFVPHVGEMDIFSPQMPQIEDPQLGDLAAIEESDKSQPKHKSKGSGHRVLDPSSIRVGGHSAKGKGHKGPGRHRTFHGCRDRDEKKGSAPLITSHTAEPHIIEDQYIIVFKKDAPAAMFETHFAWLDETHSKHLEDASVGDATHRLVDAIDAGLHRVFDIQGVFRGYSGKFLPATIELIRQSPLVEFVEHDSIVHASHEETENGAPWGLARVSHRKALSLGTFNKYLYDDEGGEGVTAYVVDTGIYVDHEDFEGRAKWGKTIPANDVDKDAHGHGTHCAGTMVGKEYGIAKKANIVAVKVLGSDGSGTMSDVIGGVEYVVSEHNKNKKAKKFKGSTANMSLGGGKSPSLDIAVNAAVNAGVHFAVAAGNENQDACNVSPAGASEPVTVGASTVGDERAYFSNYGKCTDIFAPGVNVLSAGTSSPTATQIMSGTSMASPHIAGLLTYFLSLQPSSDSQYATNGAITPRQLKKNLIAFGTDDVLTDVGSGSPNVLAFNGGGKDISAFFDSAGESNTDARKSKSGSSSSALADLEMALLHYGEEFAEEVRGAAEEASHALHKLSERIF